MSNQYRSLQEMFESPAATPAMEETGGNGVTEIPIADIHSYLKQGAFKPYAEQKLQELADSIKEHGVLSPVLVRPRAAGGYELIAGHNRRDASKLAGKDTVPAIIRDMDDETADILFVETNMNQRELILISERAKGYRIKYDAMKRQGARNDLSGEKNVRGRVLDQIAEDEDMTGSTVFRYVRLGYLCDELLDLADLSRIIVMAGVELSYIENTVSQQAIAFYLQQHDKVKIQHDAAKALRKLAAAKELTGADISGILAPVAEKQSKPPKDVKIPVNMLRDALGGEYDSYDDKSLIALILTLLRSKKADETEVLNE